MCFTNAWCRFHAGVGLEVLVAGPVLKVCCLALIDVAVDLLVVVVVELHIVIWLRPRLRFFFL